MQLAGVPERTTGRLDVARGFLLSEYGDSVCLHNDERSYSEVSDCYRNLASVLSKAIKQLCALVGPINQTN